MTKSVCVRANVGDVSTEVNMSIDVLWPIARKCIVLKQNVGEALSVLIGANISKAIVIRSELLSLENMLKNE